MIFKLVTLSSPLQCTARGGASAMGLGMLWVMAWSRLSQGLVIAIGHLVLTDSDIQKDTCYHLILIKRAAPSSRGTHAGGVGDKRGHRVSQDVGSAFA
ncbi:hypothetical protein [Variovorax paradoxus]|uniref:hypothetical protein n=1 Tax=Variovorax paradoxus TaxID=34073 RepID=UPI003D65DE50